MSQAFFSSGFVGKGCGRNLRPDDSQNDSTDPVTVTQHTLSDL